MGRRSTVGIPIRVLCVFSSLNRGGAETMCMNLYRNINRENVQFDFIKHTEDHCAFEEEIIALGGRIYTAPKFKGYNLLAYMNWWSRHFLEHPEHRIVHGHYYTVSALYFTVAHKINRITIGHSHSTQQNGPVLSLILKKVLRQFVGYTSDYCLACSTEAGKWLFPRREFQLLHNAISVENYRFDSDIRTSMREELGLQDQLVLGTVGSIKTVKNPFGLVDIFAAVKRRIPDARLLWVGDGELRSAVQEKLKEHGLRSSVIFTGVRSDVNRLLQAMDVFLLPSFSEGLPVVTVEAQSAGLPCLISDVVSREAAITDLCTFLPYSKPELWADAVQTLELNRKDTRAEVIKAGYDIRTTAKWLEGFYVNL